MPMRYLTPARGSGPWLVASSLLTAVLAAAPKPRPGVGIRIAAGAGLIATAGLLWFFRDPERQAPSKGLLAAADGRVQAVEHLPDGRTRIAVYMNLLDVHVNRAPISGTVLAREHFAGGHRPAFRKESERNERVRWTLSTEIGTVEVIQIAGTMVRRIVPYLDRGDRVSRAGRLGLIRFGSRVDVVLPSTVTAGVRVGERVRAGLTRIDAD
jgi:phosphatidylserine decarboxylase